MKKVLDYIKTKRGGKSMNAESNVATFTPTYGTLSAYASSESIVSSNDNISIYEPGSANKGWTKLHIAAWVGDVSKLKSKLKKIDIDTRDDLGRTALHLASAQGHARAVSFLLSSRADATIQDYSGKTSLHKATEFGHRECMQLLLDRTMTGLVNIPDMVGDTPLQVATALGNYDMSLLLLQMGAEVEVQNSREQYPLHRACLSDTKDTYELVELLLRYGSLINVSDVNNVTPLMLACEQGSINIVRLFIEYGAEIKAKDINGKTAYDYAAEHNFGDIEQLLKSQDDTVELNIPKIKSQESMNVITPPDEFDGTDSDWPEDDDVDNSGDNLLHNFYNHPKIDVMKVESQTACSAMVSTQIPTETENNDCDKLLVGPALDRSDFLSPLPKSRENSFNSHPNGDGEPNDWHASEFSTQETRLHEDQDLKRNNDAVETSGSDWDDDFSAPINDEPTASSKKSAFRIAKSHAQDQISFEKIQRVYREVLPFENLKPGSNPDSPNKVENVTVARIELSTLGANLSAGRRDYPKDESAQNKPMEDASSWSSNSSNISDKVGKKSNDAEVRNQMHDDYIEVEETSKTKECETLNKMEINTDNESLKHTKTLEKYDQLSSTKSNETSEKLAASNRVEQNTDEMTNFDVVSSNSSSLTDVSIDGCVAQGNTKNDSDDQLCVEKYNASCEPVVKKNSANNSVAEQSMGLADVSCTKLEIEEQPLTRLTTILRRTYHEVKDIPVDIDHAILFSRESDTLDLKNVSASHHENFMVRDDEESLDSASDFSLNALWHEGAKESSASNVMCTFKDIGADDTPVEVHLDGDTMLGVDEMWVSNDFILDDSNPEESDGKENRLDEANVVPSMENGNIQDSSPICDNLNTTLNENVYDILVNHPTKKVEVADETMKDNFLKEMDLPVTGISRIAKRGNIVSGSSVPVKMPDKVTSKIESLFMGNIMDGNYRNEKVNISANSVEFESSGVVEGSDRMEVVCCLDIEEESFASSRSSNSTNNKSTEQNMICDNEKEEHDLEFDNEVDPRDLNSEGGSNRSDENFELSCSKQIFDKHSLFKDPSKNQHNYSPHGGFCHQGEPDPKFLSTISFKTNRLFGGSFGNLKKFWHDEFFRKKELRTNISCEPYAYPAYSSKQDHPFHSFSKTYPFVRFLDSVLEVNADDRIDRNDLEPYIGVSLAKNQFISPDVQLRCEFSSTHGTLLPLVSDLSASRPNISDADVNLLNHATNAPRRTSGRILSRKYVRRSAIKRKLRPRRIKYSSVDKHSGESFTFSSPLQPRGRVIVEDSEKLTDVLLRSWEKPYDSGNIMPSGGTQVEYESAIVTTKSIIRMEDIKNLGGIAEEGGGDVAEDNELSCQSAEEPPYSFEEMILEEDSPMKNDAVAIGVAADVRSGIDILNAVDTDQSIDSVEETMQVSFTLDQNLYELTDKFRSGDELSKQSAPESGKNDVTLLFGTKFEEFSNCRTRESRSRIGEHISPDNDGSSIASEILPGQKELANGQENVIGRHFREPLHAKESVTSGSSFDSPKSSQGLMNLPKSRWIGNETGNESGSDTWSTKIQTSDKSVQSSIKEQLKLLVDLDIQPDGKCDKTRAPSAATDISREKKTESDSCECVQTGEMDATCVVASLNLCNSSANDKDVHNLYNASNAGILLLTTDCATSDTSICTSHSSAKVQELNSSNGKKLSNTVPTGPMGTVSMPTQDSEKETTRSTRSDVREAVILLREEYNEVEATLKKHNNALDILSSRLYGELRSYPSDPDVPIKDKKAISTVVSQEINPHFHVKALEEELETLRKRLASKWFDESSKALDMVAFLQEEKRALQATINGLNQTLVDQRIKVAELTEQNKRYKGEKQMLQNDLEAQIAEVNYLAKRGAPSDPSVVRKLTKLEEQNRELNASYKKLLKSLEHQDAFRLNKISKISGEDQRGESVVKASLNDSRGASPSRRTNRMIGTIDDCGVVENGVNCSNGTTTTTSSVKPTQSIDVCRFEFGETIETRRHDEKDRGCDVRGRRKLEKSSAIGAMGDDNNGKTESCDREEEARRVANDVDKGTEVASQMAECSGECRKNSVHPAKGCTDVVKNTKEDGQDNRTRQNNVCQVTQCNASSEIEPMGSFVFTETNAARNVEFSSKSRPFRENNHAISAQKNHKESFKRKKLATKRNVVPLNLQQRKRLTRNKLLNVFSDPCEALNVCRAESASEKLNGVASSLDRKITSEDSEMRAVDKKIVSSSKSTDSVTQTEISMDNCLPEGKHRATSKSSSSSVISTECSRNKSGVVQKTEVLANIRPQTTMKSENEVETSIRKSMCCKREDINNFSRNDQTLHIFCPLSTFVEIDGSKEIDSVTELLARMLSQQRLTDDSASAVAKNDVCNSNLRLITEFPKDVSSQCWSRPQDCLILSDSTSTSRIANANVARDFTLDGGDKNSSHADNSIVIEYPSKLDEPTPRSCDDQHGVVKPLAKIKTSERVDSREERKPVLLRKLKLEVVINVTNDLSIDRTVIKPLYDVPATNESSVRDRASEMIAQVPLIDDTAPIKQSDDEFSKILINRTSSECDEANNSVASVRLSEIREEYGKQRMNDEGGENPELNFARAENNLTLVREKQPTGENELAGSTHVVRGQSAKSDGQESNVNLNIKIVASRVDESPGERKFLAHSRPVGSEEIDSRGDRQLKLAENHPSSSVSRKRQSAEAQTVEVIETVSVGVGDSGENESSSLSREVSADPSKASINTASGEDPSMLEPLIDLLLASLPSNTRNNRLADTKTSTKLHREIKDVLAVLRMQSQLKPASSDSENAVSGEDTKTRASSRHHVPGDGRKTSGTLTDPPKKSNLCRGKKSRGCTSSVRFDPRIKCCSSDAVDAKTPCSKRTEFIQGVQALTRENKVLPLERSAHGGEDSKKIDADAPVTSVQNGSLPDMSQAHRISVKNCSIFGTQYAVTSFSGSDPTSPTILIGGNRVKPDETLSSVSCPMHPTRGEALENTKVSGSGGKCEQGELNIGDYAGNHWTSVDAWNNLRDELMRIKQRIFEEEDALAAEKQLLHAPASNSRSNTIHSEPVGGVGSLQNEVDELLKVLGMKEVADRSRPVPLDLLRCSVEARKVCGIIEKHVLRKRDKSGSDTKDFGVDIRNEKEMIMECINRASSMLDDIRLPSETASSSGIGSSSAARQCEGTLKTTNFSHPLMDCISRRKSASTAATASQGRFPPEHVTCEPRRVHRQFDKSDSKLRNLLNWNPIYEKLPADQDEQLKRLSAVISKASERLPSKKLPHQIGESGNAGKLRSGYSSLASKFVPTGDKSPRFGTDTRALSTEEQMWYCQKMLRNSNRYDSSSGKGQNSFARTANIDVSRPLRDGEKGRGAKVGTSSFGTDKSEQQERIGGFLSAGRNRDSYMGRNANRGDSSVTVNVRSTRARVTLRPRSAGASSSYHENFLGPVECVSKSRTNRGIFRKIMLGGESRREGSNSFSKTCGGSAKRNVDKFRNFLPDDSVIKEFRSTYFSS